ncbi:HNH endonuclease [Ferdinandcohnia quinoae]|uniref:HNH endonuclease n=1 Tax=Fredinandcohnia quinoae TaxID=2918902 RepID=A0AAW5DZJ1_9BACI|nr:HNH endonuclease domain-containing protein [Fredinandcohnia sp. SECRCQ15]MCH1624440.1 HNH endonuclease [Fredinandcohnia sp. SECRCQ15]
MSHKLQVGEMSVAYLTDKDIWSHFNYIYSPKSKNSTTYKFVLIKSIIENLYNVNDKLELSYDRIFSSFAKIYWNLVIHHDLNQINMVGKRAEVQNVLLSLQEKHGIPNSLVFDKLSNELQVDTIMKVKKKCKINVMGAIYGDTSGAIYDFDNKKEFIKINSSFYSFMQRFQKVLTYVTNYHLALFLEKFNEQGDTTKLLLSVENVSKRTSLDHFYYVLESFYGGECFYCGKKIKNKSNSHVDHFIPWSFVQADQLWNLVISCSTCNLAKSDKLAKENYLSALIDRNNQILGMTDMRGREDMQIYTPSKLEQLYHFSIDNGYTDFWTPIASD